MPGWGSTTTSMHEIASWEQRGLPSWTALPTDECKGLVWTGLNMAILSLSMCVSWVQGMPGWTKPEHWLTIARARVGVEQAELGCGISWCT